MTEQHEPAADGAEMPPAEDPQPGATEAPHTEGAGSDAFGAARHATAQAATALGAAVDQATPVMKALAARAADLAAANKLGLSEEEKQTIEYKDGPVSDGRRLRIESITPIMGVALLLGCNDPSKGA